MNERDFANRIRRHLDRGLQQISRNECERLHEARNQALAMQHQAQQETMAVGVGHFFLRTSPFEHLRLRNFFVILMLLAIIGLGSHWYAESLIADLSTEDSALLADEIPVEAFIDQGFESWLKNSR